MGKRILAMVAGLISAFLVIVLVEGISITKYPLPKGVDPHNAEAMKEHVASLPVDAFLIILFAYAAGAFTGSFVAVAISKIFRQAMTIALVLLIANTANLVQIDHPLWFAISSTFIYFPLAWLGGKAGMKVGAKRE